LVLHQTKKGGESLMAAEMVTSFLEKASESDELKGKLENIKNLEELVDIAKEAGFNFSLSEMIEVLTKMSRIPVTP
jgi:predicted ribosomally synthesized peptide with nif11-like leader